MIGVPIPKASYGLNVFPIEVGIKNNSSPTFREKNNSITFTGDPMQIMPSFLHRGNSIVTIIK